jgi:multidrug efflux pump subunit AcrB
MNGSIAWFARNPAVANLLMVMLLLGGWLGMSVVRQETLPNVPLDRIGISVQMAQASPALVETLLCAPVEQAVAGIEGLSELTSEAYDGLCMLRMDVQQGYQTGKVLDQVRVAVDGIRGLPVQASRPLVQELVVRNRVVRLLLVGALSDMQLYQLAHRIRLDLLRDDNLSVIDIENLPAREIAIEVPRDNLHRFRLTLDEMAAAMQRAARPVTAGVLHSEQGDLLLSAGQRINHGAGYLDLSLRDSADGSALRVRDVGSLHDGFERTLIGAWRDGQPAVALDIYRVGSQQVLDVADAVQRYVNRVELPAGAELVLWEDDAAEFRARTSVLWENGWQGLLILLLLLSLALGAYLAGWIALGIPVSMLGAVALLPMLGESVNTISLFAFILVLGIVVDDAIIVGERIHHRQRLGEKGLDAAIAGARDVMKPVCFAVLTTAIAFAPLLFLPGPEGALMRVIPLVALAVLGLSLIESLWILPAHLARPTPRGAFWQRSERTSASFNRWLDGMLTKFYRPLMWRLLHRHGLVLTVFFCLFVLCVTLIHSGWVQMVLFSRVEGPRVVAEMVFPRGTPSARIQEEALMLESSARQVASRWQQEGDVELIESVLVEQGLRQKVSNAADPDAPMRLRITLKLADQRTVGATQLASDWRDHHGRVPDALSQRFDASVLQTKPDIHIHLYHEDMAQLDQMAAALETQMRQYAGVHEISNSLHARRPLVDISLTEAGHHAGLRLADIGTQIRHAFQGIEVDRLAEADQEVPVLLRLAEGDSASLWHLQQLPVFLADGSWAPLGALAMLSVQDAPAVIGHYEQRRHAAVTALVDNHVTSPAAVMAALDQEFLGALSQQWPGADWGIAGKPRAINEFMQYLGVGYMIALMAIFFVLTVLFSNYSQPLMVMTAVPFGLVGATLGHFALGIELTLWSMVGVIAVSGVVVNDNLVLLDEINRRRDEGEPLLQAVVEAGACRFRPILLTTLTTVLGVGPLILADSAEARFLLPMAVSLAAGVMFATLVSLLLVPCLMVAGASWRQRWQGVTGLHSEQPRGVEEAYLAGREAALMPRMHNPHTDPVLHAAWEAGCQDVACERAA